MRWQRFMCGCAKGKETIKEESKKDRVTHEEREKDSMVLLPFPQTSMYQQDGHPV